MKLRSLAFFFGVCCFPVFGAVKLKPFKIINLNAFDSDARECDVSWQATVHQALWIDEGHLVAWLFNSCNSHERTNRKFSSRLLFIETNGNVRSFRRDDVFAISRGPTGMVFVGYGNEVDLVRLDMSTQQAFKCPNEKTPCQAFVPRLPSGDSDFALCSQAITIETCNFYQGLPAIPRPEETTSFEIKNGITRSPYKEATIPSPASPYDQLAWTVSESQTWYFDDEGTLAILKSSGFKIPVSIEHWTPKGSSCTGDLSVSEPRRFLATCVGTHFYTDGDFDAIFGYSRIALFDVASRRIIARIDGPAYIYAVLSPAGKIIAVNHGSSVRLYRAP
jgi:hypothetical protein